MVRCSSLATATAARQRKDDQLPNYKNNILSALWYDKLIYQIHLNSTKVTDYLQFVIRTETVKAN